MIYEASAFSNGLTLGLSRCPDCHVHFARPRLRSHNRHAGEASFEKVYHKYHEAAEVGRTHKDRNYRRYLRLAEKHLAARGRCPPYSVLEIGSHCGFFLRYAKERGWTAKGVEPAPSHVRFAREVNGIDSIHQGYYGPDCFSTERFDLIAMFDVLEHISEPVEVLSTVWRHLREGGLAICKVPHVGFYLAWHRKVATLGRLGILPRYPTRLKEPSEEDRVSKLAGFFDLFEHVVHYDEEAVRVVFGNAGLYVYTGATGAAHEPSPRSAESTALICSWSGPTHAPNGSKAWPLDAWSDCPCLLGPLRVWEGRPYTSITVTVTILRKKLATWTLARFRNQGPSRSTPRMR